MKKVITLQSRMFLKFSLNLKLQLEIIIPPILGNELKLYEYTFEADHSMHLFSQKSSENKVFFSERVRLFASKRKFFIRYGFEAYVPREEVVGFLKKDLARKLTRKMP